MGLEEPDINLDELIENEEDEEDEPEKDVSEMSKKELFKKVRKEGQVNLGNNKALIECPCSRRVFSQKVHYMCSLVMRPDPEDGKQKPVCSGPLIGRKFRNGKHVTWRSGREVRDGCPYSPRRFGSDE